MNRKLKGADFVRLILAGERDFAGAKIESGFDASRNYYFADLQKYLADEYLSLCDSPITLSNASLKGFRAEGVYFAFVFAKNADFEGACFSGADLRFANLKGANLKGVNFWKARLCNAYLQNAFLADANLYYADLREAHFEGVKSLGASKGLGRSLFGKTRVGMSELKIIKNARDTLLVHEKPHRHYDLLGAYMDNCHAHHSYEKFVVAEQNLMPSELEAALVH
ncbi:MAG: pentapeptide repeat-containing protein [Candidatus Aenigmarchaeota archaeon]|nr:pentapeptide repeat-containing protein [Candidatus Aenigmarchaeota archaeon]